MKKIFMMVYSEIDKDARVLRAAKALSKTYEVYLYSVGSIDIEHIHFIPVSKVDKPVGKKAQLRFITGAMLECKRIKPDIIYGHDLFSAVPLVLYKTVANNKIKYIYDAHELFCEEELSRYDFISRLQYLFERKAIKKSDLVICASNKRAEIMQDRLGLKILPTVIRNISYLSINIIDEFTGKYNDFFEREGFSIVYAGGMLAGRRLDDLIEAVNKLGKQYKLLLVGNGPDFKRLQDKIRMIGNENIIISEGIPYSKLGNLLIHFDAGYLYYPNDSLNNRYCAPNKVFEYASIGLPIIGNKNISLIEEIESNNIGVCEDDFEKAIIILKDKYELIKKSIALFVKNNSLELEMKKLEEAVGEL